MTSEKGNHSHKETESKLWKLIIETVEPYTLSSNCEHKLRELVTRSVIKLKSEDSARIIELKDNFKVLIICMKKKSTTKNTILNSMCIKEALKELCPLWPIC